MYGFRRAWIGHAVFNRPQPPNDCRGTLHQPRGRFDDRLARIDQLADPPVPSQSPQGRKGAGPTQAIAPGFLARRFDRKVVFPHAQPRVFEHEAPQGRIAAGRDPFQPQAHVRCGQVGAGLAQLAQKQSWAAARAAPAPAAASQATTISGPSMPRAARSAGTHPAANRRGQNPIPLIHPHATAPLGCAGPRRESLARFEQSAQQ